MNYSEKKVEVKKAEPKKLKFDSQPKQPTFSSVQFPVPNYFQGNGYYPPYIQQYNDYYEYENNNQFFYNPMNFQKNLFYEPYSPYEREHSYETGTNFEMVEVQSTIEEPIFPRTVGSHRHLRETNIRDKGGMESSLFTDTPQNNIINPKNDNDRHSWSGFKSTTELMEHSHIEDTFHRHSWSAW